MFVLSFYITKTYTFFQQGDTPIDLSRTKEMVDYFKAMQKEQEHQKVLALGNAIQKKQQHEKPSPIIVSSGSCNNQQNNIVIGPMHVTPNNDKDKGSDIAPSIWESILKPLLPSKQPLSVNTSAADSPVSPMPRNVNFELKDVQIK